MDVRMPGTDGVAATRVLTSDAFLDRVPNVPAVLVLTTFDEDAAVHAALRAGASGFILKSSAPKVLADAVRSLARGGGWLDPDVTRRLLAEFGRRPDPSAPPPERLQQLTLLFSYASERVVSRGFNQLPDIVEDPGLRFDIVHEGHPRGEVRVPLSGRHGVLNALGAYAAPLLQPGRAIPYGE